QTVHTVENKTDWFTAYQTCITKHGRLPGVNLKDLSETKNISSPFWIDATYDFMNFIHCEPHYVLCPRTFCQTIAFSSGKLNFEWGPCSECNNFSCAFSHDEIYIEADFKNECKDWPGAFQYCKGKRLSLATRDNVQFLDRVTGSVKSFWLDDMPPIYLVPDSRLHDRTCIYSFNGTIHFGNCSDTSITTVCILGMTNTTPTMFASQTEYIPGMTPTTSTVFPPQTMYTKGIWLILGSTLGGFCVIIIVVLTIIIVLRRRRMKNDPEQNFNSNANNKPTTKNMAQAEPAYDTVFGESFVLEATFPTSAQVSTAHEEEPVIYARPQKVKTNCRNPLDVPFSIKQPTDENENTGLYNVVQKTHGIPNTFVINDVLGKDYDDIYFLEPGKEEAVENVYNKANFNHTARDEDQTVNMYDKANFRHNSLANTTNDDYDEAHFRHEILENYTSKDYDEAYFRSDVLQRDSEKEYENEMFHRSGS
ncbi:hypothetical protein ACJMK2_006814, partial [Sinanodonta woodiana]